MPERPLPPPQFPLGDHPQDCDMDLPFEDEPFLRVGRNLGRTLYLSDYAPDGKVIGIVDTAELAATIVAAFDNKRSSERPGLMQAEGRVLLEDGMPCGFLDTEEAALKIADRVNQVNR